MEKQNNIKKIVLLINELKNIAKKDYPIDVSVKRYPYKSCGVIGFYGRNDLRRFYETIDYIWKSNTELKETISRKTIESRVIDVVKEAFISNKEITQKQMEHFIKELLEIPLQDWNCIRCLYGAKTLSKDPLKLGPFTIYDPKKHLSVIKKINPGIKKRIDVIEMITSSKLLISVKSLSRDTKRLQNDVDMKFKQFENIIRYMIGFSDEFDVSIFNFKRVSLLGAIYITNKNIETNMEVKDDSSILDISQPYFTDSQAGNDKIWSLFEKENKNQIEKNIFNAIGWLGRGLKDFNYSIAFVQFIFGLESLLKFDEPKMINPSIASQISEWVALILGDNFIERVRIEKKVKELYRIRSSIAHGTNKEISKKLLYEAFCVVKSLIIKMLTNAKLKEMTSLSGLSEWIKEKKYGKED